MRSRLATVLLIGVLTSAARPSEIPPATDAPGPLSPAESAKQFRLPPGFHIELVASEPHVADPVAMAFDARGRIFVCEIHGYNLEGYLDILELNKTGKLDRAIRRVPASAEAIKMAEAQQYGTVKLLEDTDGDGRIDRAAVWADRLPPCYGVVPARDGVIVLCAPDILFLADRDGDGRAEVRETLFTGFGLYDLWSRINNPRWGVDNWIYAANGIDCGGTIRGPKLAHEVHLPAVSFRFKPDGSAIEPTSGSSGGFGLAIDDWGDRFLVSNQQHALLALPIEHRYLARNPYYAGPSSTINISSYGHPARVFPASQPDPWRLARSKDPEWVKFYGVAETTANGYFTAASGQTIYQAEQFPEAFWGNHFSVDNAQNLVHRCLIARDGLHYAARRPTENETTEFLTSTEQWFRPVNLATGPDGGLYMVDMYRAIIEDYSAIPRYLQQIYVESLIAGADKGRIWRIVADRPPVAAGSERTVDLSKRTAVELAAELNSGNAWRRQTAQRLLVERGDRSVVPALVQLVRQGSRPTARLHALHTLDGLGALEPAVVLAALNDPHYAVRVHALALGERRPDDPGAGLLPKILSMVGDPEPRVRLQLALSLGQSRNPQAIDALRRLGEAYGDDPWMRAAVLSSSAETADDLLAAILTAEKHPKPSAALVQPLGAIVGARHQDEELATAFRAAADCRGADAADLRGECLRGLIEGLKRGKAEMLRLPEAQKQLGRLLATSDPRTAQLALTIAGLVKLRESTAMTAARSTARTVVADPARPLDDRLAAVGLLAGSPYGELSPALKPLLEPRQPLDLQLAAIKTLGAADDPQVAVLLLENWSSYTPATQAAVLDAVFQRQDRLPALLDAVDKKLVLPSALDAFRRVHLMENPDAKIRDRARALLGNLGSRKDRDDVLRQYFAALRGPRDAKRGLAVYEKQCSKCHQVQGKGYVVGPDLSSVTGRSDEMLVSDILDPSNQITVGYNQYTVIAEDGRIFTGVLAAETATSVTLRREQAAEDTILRKDIDVMAASTNSMMPENLEKEVTPRDAADLIAWLREVFGAAAPTNLVLFEDDAAFLSLLTQGDGKARLEPGDRFSGAASLRITPPQRFADRVPNWQYRIVEKPQPGEFRYLRFAWKSPAGQGVMLELAADGRWPPPDKPLRRYCAGKNTTGWAAMETAPEPPREWTVVTCDLWKDFGPFTITGIAPTAMGSDALFDRIELLRTLDAVPAK